MQKVVENYILYETVGAGQYGKVYRAKNTKTNETCAIKVVPLEKFTQVPKLEEFTSNEIKTLARINNPNVIKFIEMLKTANNMYLVYEYCDGGTLEDILQRKHHLSETESLKIFKQILNAFRAIYKENILHRDLKPSNILFHNDIVKIADFGFCKKMSSSQEITFTMVGSPIYMAPEILKGYPYNIKADVWSLGVVLYEMLFGVCPYEDKTLSGLISRIDNQALVIHREINYISQSTEQLLRKMLTLDNKARMDWEELLNYQLSIDEVDRILKDKEKEKEKDEEKTNTPVISTTTTSSNQTKIDLQAVKEYSNDDFQRNL
jgi:serine/threonine protein kinase